MKILFLNSTDCRGGAAKATVRLLNAVRNHGVDASMLTQEKADASSFLEKCRLWIRPRLDGLPVLFYRQRMGMIFSPSRLSERIAERIKLARPDIIHLHWIQEGFVKIETLSDLKAPIVWTLHDSWPFTGGCHLPFECDRFLDNCGVCPALGSHDEHDLSRKIWMRKNRAWQKVSFAIVSPSRWLAEKASASSLFSGRKIVVIPNCIDGSIYYRHDREKIREEFGIKSSERVIILNASQMAVDPNKGEALLRKILLGMAHLSETSNIHLLVMGSNYSNTLIPDGIRASFAGQISNEQRMSELYSAADLLILTSLSENLSNTVMEAMACSVPSVAFNVGGMSDLIDDSENGRLVVPFDIDEFINAIIWCIDHERLPKLSSNAGRMARSRFTSNSVAAQYLVLYENVLDDWKNKCWHDKI